MSNISTTVHVIGEDEAFDFVSKISAMLVPGHQPFVSVRLGSDVSIFIHPDALQGLADGLAEAVATLDVDGPTIDRLRIAWKNDHTFDGSLEDFIYSIADLVEEAE